MAPTVTAEVALVSSKNCLVNLPAALTAKLSKHDTSPQNVVVELQHGLSKTSAASLSGRNTASISKSVYVGWTGMPSRTRTSLPFNDRQGGRKAEMQSIEIDAHFAKILGLSDGEEVGILVHLNPPMAHTINIEPVTPADWEAIELHANFLELNMQSQVRALPNPAFKQPSGAQTESDPHALVLHVSPNTTASIVVTSITPALPSNVAFAKVAPDAEVIVAPKSRQRLPRSTKEDTRSVASRQSGRSKTSGRASGSRKSAASRASILLRGVDASVASEFLSAEGEDPNAGLELWLSKEVIASDALKGASFACVSIVKPSGIRAQLDQTQMERLKEEDSSEVGRPAGKIVARIKPWASPVDQQHVLLSTQLTAMLGAPDFCGLILRIEPVTSPLSRYDLRSFAFFPFLTPSSGRKEGLRFGGDSRVQKQAVADRLKIIHGGEHGLLSGPLTDGMILPPSGDPSSMSSFDGGILRFQRAENNDSATVDHVLWVIGGEHKHEFHVRSPIPRPVELSLLFPTFSHGLSSGNTQLTGVDTILKQCMSNLTLTSSVLLTGGIGSGKTSIAQWLATRLREDYLFNATYFSCQKLMTDETRVSMIKETLTRLFMSASWCARLGGQALVILDDLDKICPVETELQVGNDNGRSRQVTEIVCNLVRQYCGISSGVTLLATAQSKDSLNSIIIGGHIVGDIISIKSPSKEVRRDILAQLLAVEKPISHANDSQNPLSPSDAQSISALTFLNPSDSSARPGSSSSSQLDGFRTSPSLDLLEVAGKTDGYMPADLNLLISRARNQCLIRTVSTTQDHDQSTLTLTKVDFDTALENFTPTSLRNVTLTHSTTTFSSIGGLKTTRDTLLETLQYPTKYAPIFAASPLRLRSGLLLYGYPGCGKTLLASAVAGECGLNFISVKGPEILNKYIGASEKSVRDLFERAQAAKPCVLFFDEFDSIAPKRGHDSTGVTDRVVNQMLTQMDGAEGLDGVYVLAATSRPDLIDPALLRPGRLDKSLLCDMPNTEDRQDILAAVSTKLHLTGDVASRLADIAARTDGFSGADLQALMYNAHLEAIHDLLGDTSSHTHGSTNSKTTTMNGAAPQSRSSSTSSSARSRKSIRKQEDFIQFLFSPTLDAEARRNTTSASASLTSRAAIAAKIDEMKTGRKRERAMMIRPGGLGGDDADELTNRLHKTTMNGSGGGDATPAATTGGEQVIIQWKHVERSLNTTRSSISAQERRRLEAIYNEFVMGRNGEMPSGEGPKDVGGRSSLM